MTFEVSKTAQKRYKKEITPARARLFKAVLDTYPGRVNFAKKEILAVCQKEERGYPLWMELWKIDTDLYQLPIIDENTEIKEVKSNFGTPLTQLNLEEMVAFAEKTFGKREVKSSELLSEMKKARVRPADKTEMKNVFQVARGVYKFDLASIEKASSNVVPFERPVSNTVIEKASVNVTDVAEENLVPIKDETFVEWGNVADIKKVLKSRKFYPIAITGHSGNGKTFGVEQTCARLSRECIRVNFTVETDEDDLLGHYILKDGVTSWQMGPVPTAMMRGAVLLLDEYDLASTKIMALQSVLEGKALFLKKINQYIQPAPGFTVVATANTKGKGSEDGRYIGTNVMNEAFLDRFPITMEQPYPTKATEIKMVNNVMTKEGCPDEEFATKLVDWANITRKTFFDGATDELIATRRLMHIVKAYSIFGNKMKSIELCLNRFDDITKQSFLDLYTKVDENIEVDGETPDETSPTDKEEIPF